MYMYYHHKYDPVSLEIDRDTAEDVVGLFAASL